MAYIHENYFQVLWLFILKALQRIGKVRFFSAGISSALHVKRSKKKYKNFISYAEGGNRSDGIVLFLKVGDIFKDTASFACRLRLTPED